MLMREVCKKCSLTKKAVEYYIEQGLIFPTIQENGYRDFSEEDVASLGKISILRGLELSIADIRSVLSGQAKTTLQEIAKRKSLEITVLKEKQKLMQELARDHDWEQVQSKLRQLEEKQSVLERLQNVFPGCYGRFISLHFAPYLSEPITTEEQREAFDTIITFLDSMRFELPDELQGYLDDAMVCFDEAFVEGLSASMDSAIRDTKGYLAEHREEIDSYVAFWQSEGYKTTPTYRLQKALREFAAVSGYNDVFLPAMRRLSRSYREYCEGLQKSNEVFLREYSRYIHE